VLRLGAVLTAIAALLVAGAIFAATSAVFHDRASLRASGVIMLTALVAVGIWLPLAVWRASNVLARRGLTVRCPACGGQVTVSEACCSCGHRLRPRRDRSMTLASRPAAPWPRRDAPLGFAIAMALLLATGALLTAFGVQVSVLLGIVLVDVTLVGVALTLARRTAAPHPAQFGMRETPLRDAAKTALLAYGGLMAANLAYFLVFGPFTEERAHFIAQVEPTGMVIGAVIFAPIAEEFFFRGFIYGTLRRRSSPPIAALVTSAMFVTAHWLSGYPGWALVEICFFSIAACLVYERTGSIWPCIALHAANNASVFASPAVGALTLCAVVFAAAAVFQSAKDAPATRRNWLVPATAALMSAVLLALAGVFKGTPQSTLAQAAAANGYLQPAGFSGPGAQPVSGTWSAQGVVVNASGYSNIATGERGQREWRIARNCEGSEGCEYVLTEQAALGPLSAPLIPAADGWHATFPPVNEVCAERDHVRIPWVQYTTIVVHFTDGGNAAEGNERLFSYGPECGEGTATRAWRASLEGS
jgi:membrane protease YdiL (CAAX protease family)